MKIFCIENNFNKECTPAFFMKPETALLRTNNPRYYPDFTENLQCGISLILHVCRLGRSIAEKFAHRYYDTIGIAIDFAAMDMLQKCYEQHTAYDYARAFDGSTAVSQMFIPKENFHSIHDISITLSRNDIALQNVNAKSMIWNTDKIISHISQFVMLKMGDLILTGCPNYHCVHIGDTLTACIDKQELIRLKIK
jgi:2-keto-4-pentenoate hydratase/2-oxohepta-3-ene-1,7-dioic acid hydratase in catechol pathway